VVRAAARAGQPFSSVEEAADPGRRAVALRPTADPGAEEANSRAGRDADDTPLTASPEGPVHRRARRLAPRRKGAGAAVSDAVRRGPRRVDRRLEAALQRTPTGSTSAAADTRLAARPADGAPDGEAIDGVDDRDAGPHRLKDSAPGLVAPGSRRHGRGGHDGGDRTERSAH